MKPDWCRYERANLLLGMKRPKEALDECILLRDLAPEEAPVYALMGRAYRHLGQTDLALAAFTAALDLSPPEADTSDIRAAMDHINQPEDNEAEEL